MTLTNEQQETIHAVTANMDAIFTWDYERSRPALIKLYEKAKTSQWNATTDLDWSTDVDPEKVGQELGGGGVARFHALADAEGSPVKHFGDKEWLQVSVELQNSLLSQFMHGEQGALLCTARIVETVPWIDAKYYAATQVMDEARHVEVFAKYLDEKLGSQYRSTTISRRSSTTSSVTHAGTSPTSACRSWSKGWRWPRSASCTRSRPNRC
jgi:hypothetical protein